MNLRSAYILQVLLSIWRLPGTERLLILCRQVQSLRLHSAVLALVQVIHRLIMHFQSDIQHVTSLTVKALSFRTVRLHQLHLWTRVLLRQQRLIRASLQQQRIWMLSIRILSISLTRQYTRTEYLTATE